MDYYTLWSHQPQSASICSNQNQVTSISITQYQSASKTSIIINQHLVTLIALVLSNELRVTSGCLEVLLAAEVDATDVDGTGKTPVQRAVEQKDAECLHKLI